MKTLKQYEDAGFDGVDVSLDIALFEYGLIWQKTEPNEYKFIYGIGIDEDCNYNLFDYAFFSQEDWNDLLDNTDWFDTDAVCRYYGISKKQLKEGFPYTISDAISYYGFENIFGGSYDGFPILEEETETA